MIPTLCLCQIEPLYESDVGPVSVLNIPIFQDLYGTSSIANLVPRGAAYLKIDASPLATLRQRSRLLYHNQQGRTYHARQIHIHQFHKADLLVSPALGGRPLYLMNHETDPWAAFLACGYPLISRFWLPPRDASIPWGSDSFIEEVLALLIPLSFLDVSRR